MTPAAWPSQSRCRQGGTASFIASRTCVPPSTVTSSTRSARRVPRVTCTERNASTSVRDVVRGRSAACEKALNPGPPAGGQRPDSDRRQPRSESRHRRRHRRRGAHQARVDAAGLDHLHGRHRRSRDPNRCGLARIQELSTRRTAPCNAGRRATPSRLSQQRTEQRTATQAPRSQRRPPREPGRGTQLTGGQTHRRPCRSHERELTAAGCAGRESGTAESVAPAGNKTRLCGV